MSSISNNNTYKIVYDILSKKFVLYNKLYKFIKNNCRYIDNNVFNNNIYKYDTAENFTKYSMLCDNFSLSIDTYNLMMYFGRVDKIEKTDFDNDTLINLNIQFEKDYKKNKQICEKFDNDIYDIVFYIKNLQLNDPSYAKYFENFDDIVKICDEIKNIEYPNI
jgi:hypothetical protein